METDDTKRKQNNVNLLPDVQKDWDAAERGRNKTLVGMAGLAALRLLDRLELDELFNLCWDVNEAGGDWSRVFAYVDELRDRLRTGVADQTAAAVRRKMPSDRGKRTKRM